MSRNEETIFFTQPPALQELCSVLVYVGLPTVKSSQHVKVAANPQGPQPQIIRCRELIFTEPEIIATPSILHENNLTIIMQQSLYKTGRIQARLQKMGCTCEKPRRVLPADYQSCLSYTLHARLAPNWNKVGDYLIQGRDFLTSAHKVNAVHFEVHVTEQQMFFSIVPTIVKSPPSKLSDLGLCTPVIREFEGTKPEGRIEEYSIENKWCHILPSMKKGQVVQVYHQIPPDSPFKSYKDIKKHWKNTYGYRLPEDESGILYYQVYFKMIGNYLFTYPNICIRPRPVMCFPRSDPQPILKTFILDLHTKLPAICGQKLRVSGNPRYLTPALTQLTEVPGSLSSGLNLTQTAPTNKYGYRPVQTPSPLTRETDVYNRSSHTEALIKDQEKALSKQGGTSINENGGGRIVPNFHTKIAPMGPNQNIQSSQTKHHKFTPVFKGNLTKKKPPVSAANSSVIITNKAINRPSLNISRTTILHPPTAQYMQTPIPRNPEETFTQRVGTPYEIGSSNARFSSELMRISFPKEASPAPNWAQPGGVAWGHSRENLNGTGLGNGRSAMVDMYGSQSMKALPARQDLVIGPQHRMSQDLMAPSPYGNAKRKAVDSPSVQPKRARAKPVIQENLNIDELARSGQLQKVNTVTLIAWLREKGMPCKSKDKKPELMAKVAACLGLHITT